MINSFSLRCEVIFFFCFISLERQRLRVYSCYHYYATATLELFNFCVNCSSLSSYVGFRFLKTLKKKVFVRK